MPPPPRFQAEFMLRRNIAELNAYAAVFRERILGAFPEPQVERQETDPLVLLTDEEEEAEMAAILGEDYYVALGTVRQGIINLMVAGLYHLFEQQAGYSLETALPKAANPSDSPYAGERLRVALLEQGIHITRFACWPLIAELRLITHSVKHGDGAAAIELKKRRPDLFETQEHPFFLGTILPTPIRPLVGDGVILTEQDFDRYATAVRQFWEETVSALLPIMRPDLTPKTP